MPKLTTRHDGTLQGKPKLTTTLSPNLYSILPKTKKTIADFSHCTTVTLGVTRVLGRPTSGVEAVYHLRHAKIRPTLAVSNER